MFGLNLPVAEGSDTALRSATVSCHMFDKLSTYPLLNSDTALAQSKTSRKQAHCGGSLRLLLSSARRGVGEVLEILLDQRAVFLRSAFSLALENRIAVARG